MATRGTPSAEGALRGTARHVPVLLPQVLQALAPRPGQSYIDATFGAGGYSEAILAGRRPIRAYSGSTAIRPRLPPAHPSPHAIRAA